VKPQDRTRAILLSKVESSLRIVLVVLSDAMTEERETCWLKVETIAERSGLCERQVRDLLADAEERKLIRRWEGEHKSRDIAIEWDALAKAQAPSSARGGARTKGAKTAPQPAKTAPQDTGKDCHPDRQSLPPAPAVFAAATGKDCPRSGKEAGTEAGTEAGSAHTPGPQADTLTRDGRPVPADLTRLGIRPSDVVIIAEYCDTPAELLMRSQAEISRWRGFGDPGGERVAKACARAKFPLGCVEDTRSKPEPRANGTAPKPDDAPQPGAPRQPGEDIGRWHNRREREIRAGIRHLDGTLREVPHV
jgi:hypothetical protein